MSVRQLLIQTDSIAAPTKHPPRSCVLVLVGAYLLGYKAGGPIRSIANLVAALGEKFPFRIVTLDRDLGDKAPFPGVVVNQWIQVGQADVLYLRPGFQGLLSSPWCSKSRFLRVKSLRYSQEFFVESVSWRWAGGSIESGKKICGWRIRSWSQHRGIHFMSV